MSELEARYESKNLLRNDPDRRNSTDRGGHPMEIKIFLLIVLGIFVLVSSALFYHEYMTTRGRVDELSNTIGSLIERISKLEQAKHKRMPYEAYDSTLDAMAALDALEHEEDFRQNLIQNAKAHLIKSMQVGTKNQKGE